MSTFQTCIGDIAVDDLAQRRLSIIRRGELRATTGADFPPKAGQARGIEKTRATTKHLLVLKQKVTLGAR